MKKLYFIWVLLFFLSACGEYSPSKHDVVNTHGHIENIRLLENFMEDVSMNKESEVRVVNYTDEGDPIIHDLTYSNDTLTSKKDTREDEFGNQLVMEDVCESIKKIDKSDRTIYQLEGCNGKVDVIHVTIISND
ncbi:DUF4362 domain-containing protein [Bacillus sp. SG-1]|uniref:DUF4362 domain-containing protein n=1 Tax=Bacillus sp. SG-1 TaxID=161544 RepID=UPI0001543F9A|nr:DUF4362 domain-containing protein [Bacillus sp. SG-1]EDL65719.1 hypothetical protein BSG1_12631 [Bacillus sp. SG-1]